MIHRSRTIARSTLADANETRDWRIYADFAQVTDAKVGDLRILDELLPEPGSIYVLDRGYTDFSRLDNLTRSQATFVIRARKDLRYERRYSHPIDRSTGLICDQTIRLVVPRSIDGYPGPIRRIRYKDPESSKTLVFLSNNFALPALTIAELYRARWAIELGDWPPGWRHFTIQLRRSVACCLGQASFINAEYAPSMANQKRKLIVRIPNFMKDARAGHYAIHAAIPFAVTRSPWARCGR